MEQSTEASSSIESTEPPDPITSTGEARIRFLEEQLAGAILLLRQKDATEDACARRIDARYRQQFKQLSDELRRQKRGVQAAHAAMGRNAERYLFLRRHQVQIWKLGIAAEGEILDGLIDAALANAIKSVTAGP